MGKKLTYYASKLLINILVTTERFNTGVIACVQYYLVMMESTQHKTLNLRVVGSCPMSYTTDVTAFV